MDHACSSVGCRARDSARRDQGAVQQRDPEQQQQGAAEEDGLLGAQFGAAHHRPEAGAL